MKFTNENGEVIELPDDFTPDKFNQLETERVRLETENKELQESVNPNFKSMRDKLKHSEELLRKHGITAGDEGGEKQTTPPQTVITPEMVKSMAQEAVQNQAVTAIVDAALQQYDEPTKAAVKALFSKLTAGENLSPASAMPFLEQAKAAAYLSPTPNTKHQLNSHPQGQPPKVSLTPDMEARGLEIAKALGYQPKSDRFKNK